MVSVESAMSVAQRALTLPVYRAIKTHMEAQSDDAVMLMMERDRLKKQVEELERKHKALLEVTIARSRCRAEELRTMANAIQIQDADIEAIKEKHNGR